MRQVFSKNAYRHAVSWFGSENYRKAFHCTPRMSMFQADYRMLRYVVPRIFSYHYRNPLLMRMGSVDEIREALRLQLCGQQSLWDHCLGLTGVGELSAWQSLCICEHLLSKMSVQAMNIYITCIEECVRKCLDSYTCMMPLLQQFCWLNLRIHKMTHVIDLQPHGRPYQIP
ncbi:hypothetical protein X943_001932 [Babesia divergens]|uniref:Uncharacterized protein n=1 Tax=Babesia divergens TaxID=32595 RepID=A0AAD9G734_BABDI|nr:hypothetical protein X943_001932 [Babesia divergens]